VLAEGGFSVPKLIETSDEGLLVPTTAAVGDARRLPQ
jgi:hypothetical protein